MENNFRRAFLAILVVSIIVSSVFGAVMGFWAGAMSGGRLNFDKLFNLPGAGVGTIKTVNEESAVISAADKVSPAVVSIIITRNLPNIQSYNNRYYSEFFRQFFFSHFSSFF